MRFMPDTWLEALLRPLAMTSPGAHVYVEIMAPDFRFVFALVLLVLLAILSLHQRKSGAVAPSGRRSVFVLGAALAVAFVPWLATSGNGRYFASGLLIVGPVCVGLAALLPVTKGLRLTIAVGMVALQAFAVQQSAPWQAWGLAPWTKAPYFEVEVPPELLAQPATIVTMSAISYSLLGPLFHPDSRWISLHNAPPPGSRRPDARRTEAFLAKAQAGRILLLVPVVPGTLTPERLPNATVVAAIDGQLAPYRLAFAQSQACRFLRSAALAAMGLGERSAEERARSGFWLCHLVRVEASATPAAAVTRRYDAVFNALERQCPRFFPPGGDGQSLIAPRGEVRSYLSAEMKAYVYDSGDVYYKYYRALNPVLVGKVQDVLVGKARVGCDNIRGRAGLSWDPET